MLSRASVTAAGDESPSTTVAAGGVRRLPSGRVWRMTKRFDVAVVGSGFAGSLMAMIAHQLGLRVVLLERHHHPRMTIGESSTPLSNLLLEELTERYGLHPLRSLSKWGSWRASHPALACGLKRGFTFLHHGAGASSTIGRESQLLVAASPHNAIADTHWYRADLDAYLVQESQRMGVVYLDEVSLDACEPDGTGMRLTGNRGEATVRITARFVVDATGPRGFLSRALGLGERPFAGMPATQALYSHFTGARRLDESRCVDLPAEPPYPVDDAAVHHLFAGGWVWTLRFANVITSAGMAATQPLAKVLRLQEGEPAWQRLLHRLPILQATFQDATPVQPFRHLPRMAYRSDRICGTNWALLPSTAGFVDPLLSTGFPLTLLGIARLAAILEDKFGTPEFGIRLQEYAVQTDAELLAAARLISALYASLEDFPLFSAVSLLYFASASYAETVRRLGRPDRAGSFLMHDHPTFGPAAARILAKVQSGAEGRDSAAYIEEIRRAIEPIDVAGLTDCGRRNWYPVHAEDLLNAAHKVGANREQILEMLARCGFQEGSTSPVQESLGATATR